jgi:hypothetical protein
VEHALAFLLGLLVEKWFDFGLTEHEISGWQPRFGVRTLLGAWLVCTWVVLVILYAPSKVSPFIYFQF